MNGGEQHVSYGLFLILKERTKQWTAPETTGQKGIIMNELKIFEKNDYGPINQIEKSLKDTYLGVFYAIEYGDRIKIGQSKKPYTRIMALKRNAEKYGGIILGRVCLSQAHTNHKENEAKLHNFFSKQRKQETELFDINLDDFIRALSEIDIEYRDETAQIKSRAQDIFTGLKGLILGGTK